jgi:hypothetical protein
MVLEDLWLEMAVDKDSRIILFARFVPIHPPEVPTGRRIVSPDGRTETSGSRRLRPLPFRGPKTETDRGVEAT